MHLPRLRLRLRLTTLALLVMFVAPCAAAASPVSRGAGTKVVTYHGYRIVVPASWPVYDLAANPSVCVRFNRHAVYLGQPSARQQCPAYAVGRTEAILVAPLAAHGAGAGAATGPALPPTSEPNAQPRPGSSTQLAVPRAGVLTEVTLFFYTSKAATVRGSTPQHFKWSICDVI